METGGDLHADLDVSAFVERSSLGLDNEVRWSAHRLEVIGKPRESDRGACFVSGRFAPVVNNGLGAATIE